jgi:hypothetical protein
MGTEEKQAGRQHRESHRLQIKLSLMERGLRLKLEDVEAREVAIAEVRAELASARAAERKFAAASGAAGR